jgi:hypothetical protein
MKRFGLMVAVLLAACAAAGAQTTMTLQYDILGATPAVVSTYTQNITVDGVAAPAPACVAKGTTDTTCNVTIPALSSGTHTVTVSETLNAMTAALTVTGVDPNKAPKSATNTRIVQTTTIVIP